MVHIQYELKILLHKKIPAQKIANKLMVVTVSLKIVLHVLPSIIFLLWAQVTPASSWWPQLWIPHPWKSHWFKLVSLPVHLTFFIQICPVPWPKWAYDQACTAPLVNPSCRQTTLAPLMSQPSSQTVPHWLLWKTSTRPSWSPVPPTSLTATSIGHTRNTSLVSTCMQLIYCMRFWYIVWV